MLNSIEYKFHNKIFLYILKKCIFKLFYLCMRHEICSTVPLLSFKQIICKGTEIGRKILQELIKKRLKRFNKLCLIIFERCSIRD